LIAQLAIRTGISPAALLETPPTIVDEMVRLLVESDQQRSVK
jgi:hypothetical protein